jgi:PAS domain S-box-containing protein
VDDILAAQAETSGAAFLTVGIDGALLSWNARFALQWGIPESVLELATLQHLVEWLAAEGSDASRMLAELLLSPPPPQPAARGELRSLDGRSVSYQCVSIRDGRARVWGFVDTSNMHQIEAALREAGNLVRMFDAHAEGVILEVDGEGRIIGLWARDNAYFEESDLELRGRRVADVLGTAGNEIDQLIRSVFQDGQPKDLELSRTVRGQGRVFVAEVRLMPTYEGVEAARATVMIRDITEQRRMQAKLLETERLASVGLLAAGVAHEVNNPLAYTLLNLERILNGLRDLEKQAITVTPLLEAARMGLEGGRRVQTIINDLRRFSRNDDAELRVPLDVRHVLEFAIDMCSHQLEARARLVCDFGEVPHVLASEGRLSQVFLNLLVNAAQAIRPGAPEENEIRVVTRTDEHMHAVIDVTDTGEGIAPSTRQHIFEPFFTTKSGEGTGLGLAICHGIVLSIGGQITVESELGRGSTFRLILPAADVGSL